MSIDFFKRLLWFFVLALIQVFVLNHVHMFGFVTPLLYVYFVLVFPSNEPKWTVLLWSFALGIVIDTFSNTPGVASASMTLVAALQPYILQPFISRDSDERIIPGIHTMGFAKFFYYSLILMFLYCLAFFSLEMFNFFNWLYWLECIGGSTVLTLVLIWVIDSARRNG